MHNYRLNILLCSLKERKLIFYIEEWLIDGRFCPHGAEKKIGIKMTTENCIIRHFVVFVTHKTAYDKTKKKWVEQVAWMRKT